MFVHHIQEYPSSDQCEILNTLIPVGQEKKCKVIYVHQFDDSRAKIRRNDEGFIANCECGWSSGEMRTREEAIISFEDHVRSDPRHKIVKEEGGANLSSIFLAGLGILYIISPIDFVPDYFIGVGWIEDILIGILSVLFLKKGSDGKSPSEIISDILK